MNALDVLQGKKDYDDVCIDLRELGPNGGNLDHPQHRAEFRRAELNAPIDPETGLPGLHRFEKHDTACVGIKDALPWHQMAAHMVIAERTNSEIAMAAGVGVAHVQTLRAQRWFQILLGTIANHEGQEYLSAIATHAHDAINRIAEIAQGDFKELGVRNVLAANQLILEHTKGKPLQSVVSNVSHSSNLSPAEQMEDIKQQLAALRSSAAPAEPLALPQP